MFSYCGNNPTNQIDPTGQFNVWGFFGGIALTVAGYYAAPYDGGMLFATGLATTFAAATDSTMVIDVSFSAYGQKNGESVVIDFGENTVETYAHYGTYASSDLSPSASYSVGFVANYDGFGDYGGNFVEADASIGPYGFSYCQDPNNPAGAKAACMSFSTSPGCSVSGGYDFYVPTGRWGKRNQPSAQRNKLSYSYGEVRAINKKYTGRIACTV